MISISRAPKLVQIPVRFQASPKRFPFVSPAVVNDRKISSADDGFTLLPAPFQSAEDVVVCRADLLLVEEGPGAVKVHAGPGSRAEGLLVDLRIDPAGAENERIEIGAFVVDQLAHFNKGDLSEAISRVVWERSIRPAAREEGRIDDLSFPSRRIESAEGMKLPQRIRGNAAFPIRKVGLHEGAYRIEDSDGGNEKRPRFFCSRHLGCQRFDRSWIRHIALD